MPLVGVSQVALLSLLQSALQGAELLSEQTIATIFIAQVKNPEACCISSLTIHGHGN